VWQQGGSAAGDTLGLGDMQDVAGHAAQVEARVRPQGA
jgi:hypothetical protein